MSCLNPMPTARGEIPRGEPELLHHWFTRAARRWPNRPAVDAPPGAGRPKRRVVTYAELDRLSDALAADLRESVSGECVVAVLLPRTSERLYVAQLATLKAGAAHACVDPLFPDDQLDRIVDDVRPVALVTDAVGEARVRAAGLRVERLVNLDSWEPERPADPMPDAPWLTPESLAYVIYTSGTTGRPKGVLIEHAGVANLVRADVHEYDIRPGDRVAQNSSPSYDSSVEEVWLALAAGATLVVMDDETVRLGPDLIPWLRAERVTVLCPPPTLLRTTGCADPRRELPDLRFVYLGGEALTADIAERWGPGKLLVNGYGPTECSVTCTRERVLPGEPITIGRPLPGFRAWVLDADLNEVPEGEPGELCVGGVGLARGYHNRPELTAQKFPVHPTFGRIYRTGDRVHRDPTGRLHYHGRIDAQVKLRGYRIELEAIEARLAECAGVREAACTVQGPADHGRLVGFLVPTDPAHPPDPEVLKAHLRKTLPAYMVPGHLAFLEHLPTTVSGKLNRKALPELLEPARTRAGEYAPPRDAIEEKLAGAVRKTLACADPVSIHDDFFNHLGGDSLRAALLISHLRDDPATAALTVRDLYEARTVAELARRVGVSEPAESAPDAGANPPARPDHARLATTVQTAVLLVGLVVGALLAYGSAFYAVPALWDTFGAFPLILLLPFVGAAGFAAYTLAALGFAVLLKKVLIGRYAPTRAPVWGGFYVRNWIVQHAVQLVPWGALSGTVFQSAALRLLGARIGRRVHIHRGVDLLRGGWDLLDIGDDVTLGQESAVRLVELHAGEIVVGPVSLGAGSTLEVRAGVGGDTRLEDGAYLTALSYLPRGGRIPKGERWDGVPAQPSGPAPSAPELTDGRRALTPLQHGVALMLARAAVGAVVLLPFEMLGLALVLLLGGGYEVGFGSVLLGVALVMASVPVALLVEGIAARLLGRVRPGVIGRWSAGYIRVWLKAGLVDAAGTWLSGTLFWPAWLRLAGMKIGRGCEISTIIDVVPELVEIGEETFFADGIYLGGPRLHRGTATLRPVRLGRNTFLGNHAVVAEGQQLPPDVLFGIATVADGIAVPAGSSWFGIPAFELPRREVIEMDRSLTHDPSPIRYWNRVLWEVARAGLPVVPFLLFVFWFEALAAVRPELSPLALLFLGVPAVTLATVLAPAVLVVAVKWALLGRVKPGTHALWSCWCCRWDFVYMCWAFYGRGVLAALEGTLLLSIFLRAMGARIGRRVVLGPGFAHVVDPDMLHFEDGATVSALFQAHTFEDRVLKIDHVFIRSRATVSPAAVLLYGADIGRGAEVGPHSVVMKRERLLPGRRYAGCPTRPVRATPERSGA
jgi:non-ribosomal peptide synthetase-like protein